jgi:hypothetical protein
MLHELKLSLTIFKIPCNCLKNVRTFRSVSIFLKLLCFKVKVLKECVKKRKINLQLGKGEGYVNVGVSS